MKHIGDLLTEADTDRFEKKEQPRWVGPMLATLTQKRFSRSDWIYERKLDGERCIAYKKGGSVRLMSRNKKKINSQYPEIVKALEDQEQDFILDGEIVAFKGNVTSFSMLQPRMHRKEPDLSIRVYYYVFDILHCGGYALTDLPLGRRKHILKNAVDYHDQVLRFTPHRNKEGEKYLKEACQKGWEGLIAKDRNSAYRSTRSRRWLKFKCTSGQELVICGYTPPGGSRKYFGALIVGYYENGKLKDAGKVGTGYDEKTLAMLYRKMKPLKQDKAPFDEHDPKGYKEATWIKPRLVGEFKFTEWTGDNKLRHPSYLGLRDDKKPKDVRKEEPGA